MLRPQKYKHALVFDASDSDQPAVRAWKWLGRAANTVYYVGQTENLQQRLKTHRAGNGPRLTANAEIEAIQYTCYPQNLRSDLLTALDEDIATARGRIRMLESFNAEGRITYTDDGTPQHVAELQAVRDHIKTNRTVVTLSDLADLADDLGTDAVTSLCTDARKTRQNKERARANRLRSADTWTPDDKQFARRVNITDIDVFTYWN